MNSKPIHILIADDHSLIRLGITSLLADRQDMTIVAQAENGQQAIDLARSTKPDIILMDINMPVISGLEVTKMIKAEMPQIRIVMLTVSADDLDLFSAIRHGASGYLLKNVSSDQLCDAILQVYRGEVVIPQIFIGRIMQEFSKSDQTDTKDPEKLTSREVEVLTLVAKGASNKKIAETLNISEFTAKIHLSNIMSKLHLENRVQVAAYAIRKSLA